MAVHDGQLDTEGWSIWRDLIRLLGFVVASLALFPILLGLMFFRIESTSEYYGALRFDLIVGFVFTLGVAVFTVPSRKTRPAWRFVWLAAILGLWATVSGGLGLHHYLIWSR
jgi:hypothetical protein